ncbi:MAG TPA: PDDEXK nuclease domain-containing protein [Myxococcota bacterium]|nr:PDDEXK nuclease domain-containing protein [Myxococcota bacterium]
MNMKSGNGSDALFGRVAAILDQARGSAVRAINHSMVVAYWLIGREIVMELQKGQERAGYRQLLIKSLAERLTRKYGPGYSETTLKYFREFYLSYASVEPGKGRPVGDQFGTVHLSTKDEQNWLVPSFSPVLSWSHYRALMRVKCPEARNYYETEAVSLGWTKRELERQIHTMYYQRHVRAGQVGTGVANDIAPGAVEAHAGDPGHAIEVLAAQIKDPLILDFIGIPDLAGYHESDLESAIITHLKSFMLELGKGFALAFRQKRLSFDGEDFYVDLVFYNYILKCFLLIDLKMGKLTPGDVGQMDSYVRMFDDLVAGDDDNPTIGLILCAEKNQAVARYSVLNDRRQIFASRYMTCMPTEPELVAEIAREREIHLARTRGS